MTVTNFLPFYRSPWRFVLSSVYCIWFGEKMNPDVIIKHVPPFAIALSFDDYWHHFSLFFFDFDSFSSFNAIFIFMFCSQICLGRLQTARIFKICDALRDTGRNLRRHFYQFSTLPTSMFPTFFFKFCAYCKQEKYLASNLASILRLTL